jgi:hypothetical protein
MYLGHGVTETYYSLVVPPVEHMSWQRGDDVSLLVLEDIIERRASLEATMPVLCQHSVHVVFRQTGQIQAQVFLRKFEEMEPVDNVILADHGADHTLIGVAMEHFAFFEVVGWGRQAKDATVFGCDVYLTNIRERNIDEECKRRE